MEASSFDNKSAECITIECRRETLIALLMLITIFGHIYIICFSSELQFGWETFLHFYQGCALIPRNVFALFRWNKGNRLFLITINQTKR